MAKKYVQIGKKNYLLDLVLKVNSLHAAGKAVWQISDEVNLSESEVIDILNRRRC